MGVASLMEIHELLPQIPDGVQVINDGLPYAYFIDRHLCVPTRLLKAARYECSLAPGYGVLYPFYFLYSHLVLNVASISDTFRLY